MVKDWIRKLLAIVLVSAFCFVTIMPLTGMRIAKAEEGEVDYEDGEDEEPEGEYDAPIDDPEDEAPEEEPPEEEPPEEEPPEDETPEEEPPEDETPEDETPEDEPPEDEPPEDETPQDEEEPKDWEDESVVEVDKPSKGGGKSKPRNWVPDENDGIPITRGYGRVLPDGDYMIVNAANSSYYLDIQGGDRPAANGTNVELWYTSGGIGDCDAWTIKYDSEGFYRISQYRTNMSLDVPAADTKCGTNVHVWDDNSTAAQQWAISKYVDGSYRIEARCNGFSLDVEAGLIEQGTNVRLWSDNDTDAQRWLLIPYRH